MESAAFIERRGEKKRIRKQRSFRFTLVVSPRLTRYPDSGPKRQKLRLASLSVRTLQDNSERQERRTAIIARELSRYNIAEMLVSTLGFGLETVQYHF